MTRDQQAYIKCVQVVSSCETLKHLKYALNYISLTNKRIKGGSSMMAVLELWDQKYEALKESSNDNEQD